MLLDDTSTASSALRDKLILAVTTFRNSSMANRLRGSTFAGGRGVVKCPVNSIDADILAQFARSHSLFVDGSS